MIILISSLNSLRGAKVLWALVGFLVVEAFNRLSADESISIAEERHAVIDLAPFDLRDLSEIDARIAPADGGLVAVLDSDDAPLDSVSTLVRIGRDGSEEPLVSADDLDRLFGYSIDLITNPVFDGVSESIFFSATIGFVPIGIYQYDQGVVRQIVEPDSPIVGLPGQPIRAFRPEASYRGELVFSAIRNVTESSGLFRYQNGEIHPVVGLETTLPGGFGNGDRVEFKALQGKRIWFEKTTRSVPPDYGLFIREADESLDLILRRGDSIPRTGESYLNCLYAEGTRDRLAVLANSDSREVYLLEVRGGLVSTLAGPGDQTSTGEIITSIGIGQPIIELGRIYFGAEILIHGGGGMTTEGPKMGRLCYWENGEVHLLSQVLGDVQLPVQVTPEHVVYISDTALQGRRIIRTQDRLGVPSLRSQWDGDRFVFDIQDEFELEFSAEIDEPSWRFIGGGASLDWPLTGSQGFFRLRHF